MYVQRVVFVWVFALLGFLACSTAPTGGTSSTSTSTSTTGGGTGGTGGTGGMEAGLCEPREDYYEFCGDCRRCLEEKCCAEIIACENEPGCIACVSHDPNAGPCGTDAQFLLNGCSAECEPCHPLGPPNPGCFLDAGADGG